ncbi:ABC transporter permease [bacterium]|nr:ABC transporter permease [bacterium]
MKLSQIIIIYRKEMLDILRDRRTLASMILIPIIMFPLMTIGLGSIMGSQIEKMKKRIYVTAVVGGEHAPELVEYLKSEPDIQFFDIKIDTGMARLMLADKTIQAAVNIPAGFQTQLYDFIAGNAEAPHIEILSDMSEMESEIAGDKIREVIGQYRSGIVTTELEKRNIRPDILKPFFMNIINTASSRKMGGFMLGMILPYMVILLAITGGMYPAIDLTAGEKERGTLETLLVSPAGRFEIVFGKFFTVMTASLITTLLAIASLLFTYTSGFGSMMEMEEAAKMSVDFAAVFWVVLMMLPLSATFSALLLTLGVFAKSYKEAQSYMTPLMILVILPAMVSIIPGITPTPKLALIPVVNVSLMLKEALMGRYDLALITITIISSLVYAFITMFIAFKQFQREEVLFRI